MIRFQVAFFSLVLVATGFMPGSFAYAQEATSTPSINAELQQLIDQLKEQITQLQAQVEELKTRSSITKEEFKEIKETYTFIRTLRQEATGEDVKVLQEFLKESEELYPEGLVTSYFGPLTENAVKRFQKKNNIVASGTPATTGYGQVGPRTRTRLNELIAEGAGASGETPSGLLEASGLEGQFDIGTTTATTSQSTTTDSATDTATSTAITDTTTDTATSTATTTDATAVDTSTDSSGGGSGGGGGSGEGGGGSTPDTTSPTISNIAATNVTPTSATITWTTNEASDSTVEYASSSPITNPVSVSDSSNVTSHSIALSGLTSATTYYYVVVSADSNGNTTTSSEVSFTTQAPDATAPVISSLTAINITDTTATITWTTDESSDSKVVYDTTSPLSNGTSTTVSTQTTKPP